MLLLPRLLGRVGSASSEVTSPHSRPHCVDLHYFQSSAASPAASTPTARFPANDRQPQRDGPQMHQPSPFTRRPRINGSEVASAVRLCSSTNHMMSQAMHCPSTIFGLATSGIDGLSRTALEQARQRRLQITTPPKARRPPVIRGTPSPNLRPRGRPSATPPELSVVVSAKLVQLLLEAQVV